MGSVSWCGCGNERPAKRSGKSGGGAKEAARKTLFGSSELDAKLRVNDPAPPLPSSDAPSEAPLSLISYKAPGSFKALRPVAVHRKPSTKAPIIGAIAKFTRLPRGTVVAGEGCAAGFVKLAPGAYVCKINLKPDARPPSARRQPVLGANRLTPGTYGYIRTGGTKLYWLLEDAEKDRKGVFIAQSDTVRWAGKRFHKGKSYWRITNGYFVPGDRVRRFWPSRFKGVDLLSTGRSLPLVFMVGMRRRKIGEKIGPIPVRESPGGKIVSELARYTAWPVDRVVRLGESRWFRIPDKGWVESALTRLATRTDPPDGLHPNERWIDVDLEEQTLVAYRGQRAVYATLVSAGVWKYPTPVGVFRIYRKKAEADMKSEATADEKYRVDHVPWTMYFHKGYALHGAYWHDGFGHARSHGCINLSPGDARYLYHFVRPVMPDGWIDFHADEKQPGTVLRTRGEQAKRPEEGRPPSRQGEPSKPVKPQESSPSKPPTRAL